MKIIRDRGDKKSIQCTAIEFNAIEFNSMQCNAQCIEYYLWIRLIIELHVAQCRSSLLHNSSLKPWNIRVVLMKDYGDPVFPSIGLWSFGFPFLPFSILHIAILLTAFYNLFLKEICAATLDAYPYIPMSSYQDILISKYGCISWYQDILAKTGCHTAPSKLSQVLMQQSVQFSRKKIFINLSAYVGRLPPLKRVKFDHLFNIFPPLSQDGHLCPHN